MKNKVRKIGFFLTLACSVSVFAGCNKKDNSNKENETPTQEVSDEQLMQAIASSNPSVDVEVGEYEHLERTATKDVDALASKKASSSWLDAPRDVSVNIIYDSTANSEVQYTPSLMNNLVKANEKLHTIIIKDRGGNYLESEQNNGLLSTDGTVITVAKQGGFDYGEVYQIEINEAPFLCFENKDSSIRTLTIEIEDDPNEEATYNEKEKKTNITNVSLNKVSNKNINKDNNTCTFEYAGAFPNLSKGNIFYVTGTQENDKLDFYGSFESKELLSNGHERVTYTAPEITDIYESLRLKGEQEIDIEHDGELKIDDEVALRTFKQSSLARGIARAALPLVENDLNAITSIISNFSINVKISMVNNCLSMKFSAGIYNYKVSESKSTYITIEFGYEKITDYTIDFDVSIETKWIIPVGVNYKVKCVEDTQEIFFLKATITIGLKPDTPKEKSDWTDAVVKEMDHVKAGDDYSALSVFKNDPGASASTSGGKTTWPLLIVDVYALSPISFRLRVDFYIDAGFQALMCFQQETHSKKVDFCFSNAGGASEDAENTITKSSNWSIAFAGNIHLEVGFRVSFSFSLLGLHDYLHAEAYAELFINASVSGMLLADISFEDTITQFSGYMCIDLAVTVGMRVGLDFKLLFVHENVSKTLWFFYLVRVLYENAMEHWSTAGDNEIYMENPSKNLNDTNVLWFNCFNSVTMGFEDKKFKAEDMISPFSGILVPQAFIDWTSTHLFEFEVLDHKDYLSIDEDGRLHVSDIAPVSFDARIRIGVSNWGGTVSDKEFTVHFTDADTRDVYITFSGGNHSPGSGIHRLAIYVGAYRPTHTITLPEAPERRGLEFVRYETIIDEEYTSDYYQPGQTVSISTLGNKKIIEIAAWYRDKEEYKVNFYDGNDNLVYEDIVYEGESAVAPYAAMRDRYMDTSKVTFVGWDRKLDDIKGDTDIHGIYIGIGGK